MHEKGTIIISMVENPKQLIDLNSCPGKNIFSPGYLEFLFDSKKATKIHIKNSFSVS